MEPNFYAVAVTVEIHCSYSEYEGCNIQTFCGPVRPSLDEALDDIIPHLGTGRSDQFDKATFQIIESRDGAIIARHNVGAKVVAAVTDVEAGPGSADRTAG